jgi:general secretion pathway protein J
MALGGGGRSWLRLSLDRHDQRTGLVLLSQPELADPQIGSPLKKPLMANVQRVDFSYYGRLRSDRIVQWRDRWIGEGTLPELVRIRMEFPASDPRVWPELVIKPRIAVDVACSYETLTKSCRGR